MFTAALVAAFVVTPPVSAGVRLVARDQPVGHGVGWRARRPSLQHGGAPLARPGNGVVPHARSPGSGAFGSRLARRPRKRPMVAAGRPVGAVAGTLGTPTGPGRRMRSSTAARATCVASGPSSSGARPPRSAAPRSLESRAWNRAALESSRASGSGRVDRPRLGVLPGASPFCSSPPHGGDEFLQRRPVGGHPPRHPALSRWPMAGTTSATTSSSTSTAKSSKAGVAELTERRWRACPGVQHREYGRGRARDPQLLTGLVGCPARARAPSAWRLDVAHIDPLSPRLHGSQVGTQSIRPAPRCGYEHPPAIGTPGPRAARAASTASWAALPCDRGGGLPKLYDPEVSGGLGGPVRDRAALIGASLDGDDPR